MMQDISVLSSHAQSPDYDVVMDRHTRWLLAWAWSRAIPGRASHEPRSTGIIVIEESAHYLSCRIKAGNRPIEQVQHLTAVVDLQPSVGEGQPARCGIGDIGRGVELLRPI